MRPFWTVLSLIWNVFQTAVAVFPKIVPWLLTVIGIGGIGDDLKGWERWLMDEAIVRVIALGLLVAGVIVTILIWRQRTSPQGETPALPPMTPRSTLPSHGGDGGTGAVFELPGGGRIIGGAGGGGGAAPPGGVGGRGGAGGGIHLNLHSSQQTETEKPMSNDGKIPPGSSGNFNIGQQGGTVNQTYINQGPQKLQFSEALGRELLSKVSRGNKITVTTVGNNADQAVGAQVVAFLRQNGYDIEHNLIGMMVPAPESKLEWNTADRTLLVAPSA